MAKKPFSQEEIQDIKEYKQYLDDTITRYKSLQEELKKYNKYVTSNAKEAVKAQLVEITKQVGTYKEITSELKKYQSLVNKIEEQEKKINQQTKERADDTETIVDNLKEQNKELEEQAKRIKTLGDDWNEIDDLQTSISSAYGKQYGDVGAIQKKIDGTKAIVSSISEVLKNDSKSYEDQLDKILEISERYKEFPAEFARMNKERKRGTLTEKGMIDQLRDNLDEFDEMISKIKITNEETQQLVDLFKKLRDEQEAFNNAQKTKYEFKEGAGELGNRIVGNAPYVGEAMSVAGSTAGKIFSGESLGAASLVGAGYIVAKGAAYEAALADIDSGYRTAEQTFIGKTRKFEAYIERAAKDMEARAKEVELQEGFTKTMAGFDFDTEMIQLEKQFNKVSKTAFFGSGLGSVKYAKDQLELAGISADTIVSTMTEMSMGANNAIQGLSEDVAVFSKKTGIASSQVASLTGMFRMLDKSKGVDAFDKLQESLSKIKFEGINPADIAAELANAGELALEYNIRSTEELVKQVQSVREMGGSWTKIAEAGKGMVLNYKDSIRKEMQLSALLGENVDLSEVRALFAANRAPEAYAKLKSSGILEKAQNSGLFGTNLLSGALMNMPLEQVAAQPYEKGKTGKGIVSNQEFLKAFQDAAKQQKIDSAIVDVERAVIRMRGADLERGLIESVGLDAEMTELESKKIREEINKFFEVELGSFKEGLNASLNPFYKYDRFVNKGKTSEGGTIIQPKKSGFRPGDVYENQTDKKNIKIEGSPTAMVKPLESADKSLKKIDASSMAQTTLLQNIQTLTAAMAKLSDPTLGIKMMIDGKDVKTSIEKIQAREKGKMRV